MEPKNLNELSAQELCEFFDSFDHVLSDCDGCVYILYNMIEGVTASIEALQGLGKSVKFVTNNSTRPREKIAKVFIKHGLNVAKDDVINPARAAANYLQSIGFQKSAYVIGMSGLRAELQDAGIKISNPYKPELFLQEDEQQFYVESIKMDPDVGAVIICIDINTTSMMLDRAIRYLQKPGVIYIATSVCHKIPLSEDLLVLGGGYFQDLVAQDTNKNYINLGKPAKGFQDYLQRLMVGVDPKRILFVGDTLEQDINFANELGYQSLLVLTGMASFENLQRAEGIQKPKYYVNSLGDLNKLIEKAKTAKQ